MMKKLTCIVAAVIAISIGFFIGNMLGYRRGHSKGQSEGELAVSTVQGFKRLAALDLARAGQIDNGLAYLDHCLDQDIIFIGSGLTRTLYPEPKTNFLSRAAAFRAKYGRLPYQTKYAEMSAEPERADEILKQFTEE